MPRYHFNVRNGVSVPDPQGADLESWTAARAEAIRRSGEILASYGHRLALGEEWRMEVTDERGLILFHLDFAVLDAPTTTHAQLGDYEPS